MTEDKESQYEAEQLLRLMHIYWGTKVAKLARVLLEERRYYTERNLPLPEDIYKMNTHLNNAIASLNYEDKDRNNFRKVAELIEAKLVTYNRRRTGELQAIRLCDYERRCKGGDGEYLLGGCTAFEKKLLETQEVMTVRGKVARPVPIIIPQEAKAGLAYLCDHNIRMSAGVSSENEYVFASGGSIVWAYDALKKICNSANLKAPGRITSTGLRKYMATVTQVLNLNDHQLQWVLNHLGHTMDVHKIHYRATSDLLERTQIAKILLLQDQGRVGEFKNRSLEDIQLEEVVFENRAQTSEIDPGDADILQTIDSVGQNELAEPSLVQEALIESEEFFVGDDETLKPKKRRSVQQQQKQMWTAEEEEEIKIIFKKFFENRKRPKPNDCLKAIGRSKRAEGLIWKRKKDTLKKKVFRMIDKLQ